MTDDDVEPALKHQRIEINCQDPSIKVMIMPFLFVSICNRIKLACLGKYVKRMKNKLLIMVLHKTRIIHSLLVDVSSFFA